MEIIEAIILGIVQGVTEWIPVSSDGIMSLLLVNFMGKSLSEAVSISLWLHLGTLAASIVFFWNDLWKMAFAMKKYKAQEKTEKNFIIIATFISLVIGVPIYFFLLDKIELSGKAATLVIGALLMITAISLKMRKRSLKDKQISLNDSAVAGFVQGFSVLPGISRSGTTISALLLQRYSSPQALRLSFLMSIPLVAAAVGGIWVTGKATFDTNSLIAIAISFFVGLGTMKLLLGWASKMDFSNFVLATGMISIVVAFL